MSPKNLHDVKVKLANIKMILEISRSRIPPSVSRKICKELDVARAIINQIELKVKTRE